MIETAVAFAGTALLGPTRWRARLLDRLIPHDVASDRHSLDAQQQEGRPQQIDELRGEKQRAERDSRGHRFRPEPDPEVPYEHNLPRRRRPPPTSAGLLNASPGILRPTHYRGTSSVV